MKFERPKKKRDNWIKNSKFFLAEYHAKRIMKSDDKNEAIKKVTKDGFRINTFKKFLKAKYGIQI